MRFHLDYSSLSREDFSTFKLSSLVELAEGFGLSNALALTREELIEFIVNSISNGSDDLDREFGGFVADARPDSSVTTKKVVNNEMGIEEAMKETIDIECDNEAEVGAVERQSENTLNDSGDSFNDEQKSLRRNIEDVKNVVKARKLLEHGLARPYSGILEINAKGYGFLRGNFYGNDMEKDAFVDQMIIRFLNLREGDYLEAVGKRPDDGKSGSVMFVLSVNGVPVSEVRRRKPFEQLVPIFPDERMKLESPIGRSDIAIRCIDLIAPIGKGQRALIVSPPKAGKTTLLKSIANSISKNNPEVKLFVLLIDERPEEVTDMQRSINAEVVYSTFDERPDHHIATAESVLKCAKRYVESGKDVCIVLDSITRLARAYNLTVEYSGRALSGGLDPAALSAPKRFFGAARNIDGDGSLTIIATALIDTGSRLDEVIFEEFKGTGNMEVVLDRRLSERRIFPALDLAKSSTRRDDLLLSHDELEVASYLRGLMDNNRPDVIDSIISEIYKSKSNTEFVEKISQRIKMVNKKGYKAVDNGENAL